MKKRLYSVICIAVMLCNIFGSMCVASATEDIVKYNYKIGMDSDASFKSMYGYNGGTHKFKKSYVAGKYGKAIELNYPGHYISNAGNRYNGYVFEFLTDDVEVGNEAMSMLDIMRDTKNLSMWVHTPQTVDHGNGAAASRTLEFIFEYTTTGGSKKYSKKFQLPNRGEWEYITLPVSYFKSGSVTMDNGIQDESYTALSRLTISFPYKDYFGANPDQATAETPWEEPLKIDEFMFDRSTETQKAITPPSEGEETYFENANIKGVKVKGVSVDGFDSDKAVNEIAVPAGYNAQQIRENVTVEVEAPYISKTNFRQEQSGATYEITAPEAVPGEGIITVTSASGRVRKSFNVKFIARDTFQPDINAIEISGKKITVPVSNEGQSGKLMASALAVIKNSDGICTEAVFVPQKEIAELKTEKYDFTFTSAGDPEIYFFDSEQNLKLMSAPVKVSDGFVKYTQPSGNLTECSIEFVEENDTLKLRGKASGDGSAFIVLKDSNGYIGAYTTDIVNGWLSTDIKLNDSLTGDIDVYISYNGVTPKHFYNASVDEINGCIEDFEILGTDYTECINYFNQYKKVLNIDDVLTDMLTESEIAGVIGGIDGTFSLVSEIRSEIVGAMILKIVNDSTSTENIKTICLNYNNIAGFDTTTEFFEKYIISDNDLKKVLDIVISADYTTIEDMRIAFDKAGLTVAIGNILGYGELGVLINANKSLLEEHIDYAKLNRLGDSAKSDFYKYVAQQGAINSLDELGLLLSSFTASNANKPSNGGSNGGGASGNVTAPVINRPQPTVPDSSETVVEQEIFSDISSSHWAYSAVKALKNLNIVNGREDGSFGVDAQITREEFVKMLMGVFEFELLESENKFIDVAEDMWYTPYINTAAQLGIVSGVTDTEFGMGMQITRQDMSTLIARVLEYKGIKTDDSASRAFADDSDIAGYARSSIYKLKNAGLISGMGDDRFMPKSAATRAQASKILYSVYEYIRNGAVLSDEYSMLARKFMALNIISTPLKDEEIVTKGQFAKYIMGFMNLSGYEQDALTYLYEQGVIGDDYKAEEPITPGEAAIILCRIMGYDMYCAYADGGKDSYYSIALRYEIMPDLKKTIDTPLTFEDVLQIFDEASEAYVVLHKVGGAVDEYEISETTALEYFHKIYITENELNAANGRTINNGGTVARDSVCVGELILDGAQADAYIYLGYKVKAYYDNEERLVFIEPDSDNEVLKIDGENIIGFSGRTLKYYSGEKLNSVESEEIPKNINRIYNYNFTTEYSVEEVESADEIILIDNNHDGTYDTMNLISEETYFINQVSVYTQTVYDIYSQIPISFEDGNNYTVYDTNKVLCNHSNIGVNDVISVLRDRNSKNIIIYISREMLEGEISSTENTGDEITITIDGRVLYFTDKLLNEPTTITMAQAGNGITAYLDYRGKLAYMTANDSFSDSSYGYLVLAGSEKPGEEAFVKLYTTQSELKDICFADKAYINGVRVKEGVDVAQLFKHGNIDRNTINQLVKYKCDSDGKIKTIVTADYVEGSDLYKTASTFTRYDDLEDSYYHYVYKMFPGSIRVDENTLIMSVPASDYLMRDKAHFAVRDFKDFKSETFDCVEVYNLSKDKTAGIIVLRSDSSGGSALTYNSPIMAVKSVSEVAVDDTVRYCLTVLYNGAEQNFILADGLDIIRQYKGADGSAVSSSVEKGDIIRAAINANNEIADYHKVFDFDNQDLPSVIARGNEFTNKASYLGSAKNMIAFNGNAENPDTDVLVGRVWQGKNPYWFTGVQFSCEFGIVKEAYGTTMILQTYPGTEGNNSTQCERYFNLKNNRVYVIDGKNDEVRLGSVDDVVPSQLAGMDKASRVIISRHNDVPSIMVIIIR